MHVNNFFNYIYNIKIIKKKVLEIAKEKSELMTIEN